MRSKHPFRLLAATALALGLLALHGGPASDAQDKDKAKEKAPPKRTEIVKGSKVFLEVDGDTRRVVFTAEVCRRTDVLEQLLCRKKTKEHEAILAADIDARVVHTGLVLAGAEPGSPVKFDPKRTPPRGTTIKVLLQYEEKGKTVTVPAQQWVKNVKSGKELNHEWVFAGSFLIPNPANPKAPPMYAANDGDVICVANFEAAMLDLPIESSKDAGDLLWEAYTERIPQLETRVTVILEPVLKKK
jgi:hypothetical protein